MGLFGNKNYSAEDVKSMIQPSLDVAKEVLNQIEEFDSDSESWIEELEKMMSNIYLYMGTSYVQSADLTSLLNNKKISPAAMSAADKTFSISFCQPSTFTGRFSAVILS